MVNGYMPASLKEALAIRTQYEVIPYGGGTDLMLSEKKDAPYLFLNRIPEMKQIVDDGKYIRIGGSCTFTEVLASPLVPQIMKDAVSQIAAPAIRNAGTMAGNMGNGSAKADSVLINFVADAKLRLASSQGERIIPIEAFYKGRKKLDLAQNELIVEILLPRTGLNNYFYQKVGARNALAISRVSFAGIIKMEEERILDIAIAFGAVADTVLRFRELEQLLIHKTIAEAKLERNTFIKAYDQAIHPTQGRVSSEYRKTVCLNLLHAFLDDKGL